MHKNIKKSDKFLQISSNLFLPITLVLCAIVSIFFYQSYTFNKVKRQTFSMLQNEITSQSGAIRAILKGQYSILSAVGEIVLNETNHVNALNSINRICVSSSFVHISVIDSFGKGLANDGRTTYLADRNYFKQALNGNNSIEIVDSSRLDNGHLRFILAVPIYDNEKIVGVVSGSYNEEDISRLFGGESSSITLITDKNGNILINSKKIGKQITNIFQYSKPVSTDTIKIFRENLLLNHNGIISFENEFGIYESLGINDWMIFNIVENDYVNKQILQIYILGILLCCVICVFSICTILYIIARDRKIAKNLLDEKESLRISEEEYRISAEQSDKMVMRFDVKKLTLYRSKRCAELLCSPEIETNVPYSTIERGGIDSVSQDTYKKFFEDMILGNPNGTAIIKTKTKTGEFRWYKGDYTMIYSNSNSPVHAIISIYDFNDEYEKEVSYQNWLDFISRSSNKNAVLYRRNLTKGILLGIDGTLASTFFNDVDQIENFDKKSVYFARKYLTGDNKEKFLEIMNTPTLISRFQMGERDISLDFSLRNTVENIPHFMHLSIQMFQHLHSSDINAFILFANIDEEINEKNLISERLNNDFLTGVLNRESFTRKAKAILECSNQNTMHAFIIIDLDRFKTINDTLGHIFGDKMLCEFTTSLKSCLKPTDFLGRLGGDEFVLLLTNTSADEIIKTAERICVSVRKDLPQNLKMSGSQGISIYPSDGKTFNELYETADSALYNSKKSGRDSFTFYSLN